MRTIIATVFAAAVFVGCGYKGPLYVPETKASGKESGALAIPEPAPERPVPAQSAPARK